MNERHSATAAQHKSPDNILTNPASTLPSARRVLFDTGLSHQRLMFVLELQHEVLYHPLGL